MNGIEEMIFFSCIYPFHDSGNLPPNLTEPTVNPLKCYWLRCLATRLSTCDVTNILVTSQYQYQSIPFQHGKSDAGKFCFTFFVVFIVFPEIMSHTLAKQKKRR